MSQNTKISGCSCHGDQPYHFAELAPVLDHYADIPGSLITILQKAQELYGFLSVELMRHIAAETHTAIAKVYGVATFYTQFRFKPVGKYLIMLCQGTACHVNGSKMVEEAVMEYLHITEGETTPDGLFTLNNVACLGCCSLSPVMMINDDTYGQLTRDKVTHILAELKEQAGNGTTDSETSAQEVTV
ncbi:NADH-quinone oxidoreductase subunit NuoE [Acetobacterium wieringae]|uniref:NADH-quinone oxidoreductase subunit NuoE n=1 Tax=Acetobacterium wieringae TaxID=52694 RepID=A0ABY6HHB9_9FIRM|nr:NADH-quinone oxidoreductase subunit NuoE [Acetobacterium wieringae]UYO63938.1 NADH-quinone oxidoreductase subunit NuoE [Acetobacterium wieringae]